MSPFDLSASMERARRRLGDPGVPRKRRSDRGRSRLDPRVIECVARCASGRERPRMTEMLRAIGEGCAERSLRAPSRATVYKLLPRLSGGSYRVSDLPEAVQAALYNLAPDSEVPGRQVAFSCVNYGDLAAVSFAAGLPWLAIYQALRMPGHRPRSRGLLAAAARARGI